MIRRLLEFVRAICHCGYMTTKTPKRPRDINQLAKSVVDSVTADDEKAAESRKNPAAVALGRLGGKQGGRARADKLSPERRAEIARTAASARWSSKKNDD